MKGMVIIHDISWTTVSMQAEIETKHITEILPPEWNIYAVICK